MMKKHGLCRQIDNVLNTELVKIKSEFFCELKKNLDFTSTSLLGQGCTFISQPY